MTLDAKSNLIHRCMTKAMIAEGDQLKAGPRWITSRRGILQLFDDHLKCGNWIIDYDQIEEANLTAFRSPILRLPGYVLSLRTDTNTYHFGLNGGGYWKGELPFPVSRSQSRLRLSWLSFAARVVVFGAILYLLWSFFN